jgi:type I restriction enzyme, S subunit
MSASATLPSGWTLRPIRDAVVPSRSRNPKKEGSGSFRYVDVDALDNTKQVIGAAKQVAKSDAPSRARMLIKRGDVLFCLVRPYLKNIAIVPRELDGEVASTAYCVLRPGAGLDSRFLFYQIVRESFIHSIPTYGNSPPSARDDEFMAMSIRVAPLPEQRRIVAKIEELFSDLDAGVAALERVRANLKRYRAAVLKAAVEGRLTEEWRTRHPATEPAAKLLERILAERRAKWEQDQLRKFKEAGKTPPKGWKEKYREPAGTTPQSAATLPPQWCWVTIDQLTHLVTKGSSPGWQGFEYTTAGAMFVRSQNVRWGHLDLSDVQYLPPEFNAEHPTSIIRTGDVLLNLVGASVGRAAVATEQVDGANLNQAVGIIRLVNVEMNRLLVYFIVSPQVQAHITTNKADVARANFNLDDVRPMPMALPPLAEQAEIVAEVDRRISVADAAETQVEHALQRAARLRQAILKRAFEGKLVPQDPTDEPAAALLDRIKAGGGSNGHRAVIGNKDADPMTPTKRRSRAHA